MRLVQPRIEPTTSADWDDDSRPLLESIERNSGSVLNIFRTLARHPKLLKRWSVFEKTELRTERLLIRPWQSADVADAFSYASDEEWARYLLNVPQPYTYQDAESFITRVSGIDWAREADFAIELNGHAIGGIRLYLVTPANDVAGLGYNVGRAYWNKGYVTEAVRAILPYAFGTAGLHKVFATADARNLASIRVMQKVGMQQEALLREHRSYRGEHADEVHYGILRSEWQQ